MGWLQTAAQEKHHYSALSSSPFKTWPTQSCETSKYPGDKPSVCLFNIWMLLWTWAYRPLQTSQLCRGLWHCLFMPLVLYTPRGVWADSSPPSPLFSFLSWQSKIIHRIKAGLLWAVNIPVTDDGIWESLRNEQGREKHISDATEGRLRQRLCQVPSSEGRYIGRGIKEGVISDLSWHLFWALGLGLDLAGLNCSELGQPATPWAIWWAFY